MRNEKVADMFPSVLVKESCVREALKKKPFLAPTGAQERLMSVRSFVPSLSEALNLHLFFIMTSG